MPEWRKPRFDFRDLDPTTPSESFPNAAFRERQTGLDRFRAGSEGAGEVASIKYVRPVGLRRHRVQSSTAPGQVLEVPATVQKTAFRPRQRVLALITRSGATIVGHPPPGDQGLSELPSKRRESTADVFRVERISPSRLQAGTTTAVAAFGFGFSSSPLDSFTAVQFDETTLTYLVDTLITVDSVVFASSTEVTLTITVDGAAEAGRPINLQYERG